MIVGLAGYARSGKDTVAAVLAGQRGYQRVAFADALKAVLADVNPLVEHNQRTGTRLDWYLNWHDGVIEANGPTGWEYAKQQSEIRQLLQRLGFACRQHISPDVWVDAVFRRIQDEYDHQGPCRWVISDCRFPNEAAAIRAHGGQVWRIVRPGTKPVNWHVSETALDHYQYDQIIINDGTAADLRRDVLELVDTVAPVTA